MVVQTSRVLNDTAWVCLQTVGVLMATKFKGETPEQIIAKLAEAKDVASELDMHQLDTLKFCVPTNTEVSSHPTACQCLFQKSVLFGICC